MTTAEAEHLLDLAVEIGKCLPKRYGETKPPTEMAVLFYRFAMSVIHRGVADEVGEDVKERLCALLAMLEHFYTKESLARASFERQVEIEERYAGFNESRLAGQPGGKSKNGAER